MAQTTYRSNRTRTIVAVGVFSAFAYVCCVVFHFKAGFLTFDLKDAVMTIGAMLFGPIYGLAMSLIVGFIEFITISSTGIYGFIMNVLSSTVFVCAGSLLYTRWRTLTGALAGMLLSIISMTSVMLLANIFITPYYMGATVDDVIAMIPTILFPFNLTKAVFNAALVFLLYNPIATALRRAGFVSMTGKPDGVIAAIPSAQPEKKSSIRNILVTVCALIIAVLAMLYFFLNLGGSIELGS